MSVLEEPQSRLVEEGSQSRINEKNNHIQSNEEETQLRLTSQMKKYQSRVSKKNILKHLKMKRRTKTTTMMNNGRKGHNSTTVTKPNTIPKESSTESQGSHEKTEIPLNLILDTEVKNF